MEQALVAKWPMKLRALLFLMAGLFPCCLGLATDCPIGWAAVNALGQNGTTGGGNSITVHVSTKASLVTYAGSTTPYTIIVDSTADSSWTNTANVTVKSHKTIIGANAGIIFDGFGLDMNTVSNVIIRNLTIKNVNPTDAIAMRTTHHVWVDHCDLSACTDGLLDITIGSDYVTASWTKFHNHDKVSIANSGTGHFEDVGKNRVTYHHNWFYQTVQRNPRVGYGKGHVFNNYYTNVTSYCVGYHTGASVLVESNYFLSSAAPLNQMYTANSWEAAYADCKSIGNLFVSCTGNTADTGKAFDPESFYSYKFLEDTAANVPAVVKASAGPMTTGATNVICPTPGNGAIDFYAQTNDLKWTDIAGATSWDIYFGTTTSPALQTNKTARTFNPGTLSPNTDYFWKVIANTPAGTIASDLWRFHTALTNASKPFPADTEWHAPLRVNDVYTATKPLVFSWVPGQGAVSNRFYLGTNATLTAADFRGNFTGDSFSPGMLKFGVTNYWRVDSVKPGGIIVTGTVWKFASDATYSGVGKTEAENMVRSGTYYKENDTGWFAASQSWTARLEDGPGTLSSVWSGSNSFCNVKVGYFDESDGTGWLAFYVNETKITEWFLSANDDALHTNLISNVRLIPGDELRIAAYSNVGELVRTDFLEVQTVNAVPWFVSAASNRVINAGENLLVTNNATDSDAGQTLTYTLPMKPSGAVISGSIVNWRPQVSQANTTNLFSVIVTDNGSPSLTATQSFSVTVNPLALPTMMSPQVSNGQIGLSVSGQVGPDYAIQGSSNMVDWNTLLFTNPPTMPFNWSTNIGNSPAQFYRVKVGPPLP